MDSRKMVYRETGIIALGEGICLLIMYAVFVLLGHWDMTVLFGGLLGAVLAVGNFFAMAMSATLAADKAVKQDIKGGKSLMKGSYFLRLAVLFILLFAGVKSGFCHVIASVVPLALVRIIITVAEFFRKGEGEACEH